MWSVTNKPYMLSVIMLNGFWPNDAKITIGITRVGTKVYAKEHLLRMYVCIYVCMYVCMYLVTTI
jgi:hypothetical protein